jgi:hypothetical protein
MNKSLLTIGIILSLGTVGCAGFGAQHNSSLTAQYRAERGVDDLWAANEEAPISAETLLYADQKLGTLWEAKTEAPDGIADPTSPSKRGGDLWNPPSVSRSWEASSKPSTQAYQLSQASGSLRY